MSIFGAIPSPPDDNDFRVCSVPKDLPEKVDMSHMFAIRNQGDCGTCVGKAGAGILSIIRKVSSLYIYQKCKEIDGIPNSEGTFPRVALKVMQKNGSCPDELYPYSSMKKCHVFPEITPELDEAAANNKIGTYSRCQGVGDIKYALSKGHPILAVILIGDNTLNYKQGILKQPVGMQHGYHAVIICGYDEKLRAFRAVNSWSELWGERGFFWLDYCYADNPMWFPEAWAVELDPDGTDLKPNTMEVTNMETLKEKLFSRKFILVIVTAILLVLNQGLGWDIPEETVKQFILLILGWVGIEGTKDIVVAFKRVH